MMMNPRDGGGNRVAGFLTALPESEKKDKDAIPGLHLCKDCWATMPQATPSGFCPPCKANADKGKMGFRR